MGKATKPKANRETKKVRARRDLNKARKVLADLEATAKAAADRRGVPPAAMRIALERARADVEAKELADKWGHKRGTPETYAKIDAVPPERRQSPLGLMYERGELSEDQNRAYREIGMVSEAIKRGVDVRSASIEARVDCSRGDRDSLVESLGRIRLEVAFTAWRDALPMPRQMILDVIETDRTLAAAGRCYRKDFRTVRKRVVAALDLWTRQKKTAWAMISAEDVAAVYANIGCGALVAPRPRAAA